MSTCRFDREASDYLTPEGEPCRRDEHGDRTYHCQAKRGCAQHIGAREQTCARCLGRSRQDIRWITEHAPLLPIAAIENGVNSTALVLASPAADPSVFEARRALDRLWLYQHIPDRNLERAMRALLADDEDWHPITILGGWHRRLAADYGHDQPRHNNLNEHAAYLDRILNLFAQDPNQEFRAFRSEVAKVRSRMAIELRIAPFKLKGVPCPECVSSGNVDPDQVRLVRETGHWCEDPDCCQVHYLDDTGDRWVCPRKREHAWTEAAYRAYVEERSA